MKNADFSSIGDFTLFGFTKDPDHFLQQKLPERLGITPQTLDFGTAGHFFFHTTYGNVAETETELVLKIGLLHSPQGVPISAQQLAGQKLITPTTVQAQDLRGNALIACFDKKAPQFSVYKTLLSVPQLYYSKMDDGILCSDGPKPQLALLDQVEVDEDALVQHYLFRYVLGRHSYFADINRLLPGELFLWREGLLETRLVRDLRPNGDRSTFHKIDPAAISILYQRLSQILGYYVGDIKETGFDFSTALSGGVDSTMLQVLINESLEAAAPRKTFSYVMETGEFAHEVEYAKEASQLLKTDHTFVTTSPEAYPELLVETIAALGFPIPAESYPCKYSIAKHVAQHEPNLRYSFFGNGADSLYGTTISRKIALLEYARHIPASSLLLKSIAATIKPFAKKKAHGLQQTATMLSEINNPYSYKIPTNTVALYSDIETARRSFGDDALKKALGYRHHIENLYLGSADHTEKVHMIELLTDAYECGVVTNHLFMARQQSQIYPFLDEDTIQIGLTFDPAVRFLKGWEVKPLLKGVLEQKSLTHIAAKPKGTSVFNKSLHDWMRQGPMREMTLAIERPAFLNKTDFEKLLKIPTWSDLDEPNWFLWNMLVYDIFKKQVITV